MRAARCTVPRPARVPARQRGFLLVTAVALIVAVSLLLSVMVYFSATGGQGSARHLGSKQALLIAGTGLEHGVHALLSPALGARLACASLAGDPGMTNVAFGEGRFSVTGGTPSYPAAPTTLRLAVSAADNTLPVNGLAGYAATGRVLIGGETIDYSSAEPTDDAACGGAGRAPCLAGAVRGRDGTTAAAHAAGSPVGQYQCDLESVGGVPDLAAARGRRVLSQGVQLQEGWAVGDNGNFFRWDNLTWTNQGAPAGTQINAISMLSYAEGWAVGDAFNPPGPGGNQEAILRWNGTAWVLQAGVGAIPNTDLNAVECVNSNECWAVGDQSGGEVILRWTGGPNWTRVGPSAAIDNTTLNAIHCVASDDCWALGNAIDPPGPTQRREVILRWTGGPNWVQLPASGAVPNQDLNAIHCVATDDCWAVGDAGGGGERPNLIHWNGAAWTLQNGGLNINQDIRAVFCVATDDCWAVGDAGGGGQRPLILHWNGTAWAILNSGLNINEDLNSVHCVTADDCWAAGDAGGGGQRPLLLHWDGSTWSVQNSGLNDNQDIMAMQILGARQRPRMAWQETYQ